MGGSNFSTEFFESVKDLLDPEAGDLVRSLPPQDEHRATNMYVDPNTGKLVIEYDDTL